MTTIEQQLQYMVHAACLLAARHRAAILLYRTETVYHRLGNNLGRVACRAQVLAVEQQYRPAYHRRHPAFVLAQLGTLTAQLAQCEQQFIRLQGAADSSAHAATWQMDGLLDRLVTQLN